MSATAQATVNPFFIPTQISGCQLWFDGADSRTFSFSSGSNISQWRDKSSNAYVVNQAISSNQPVFRTNIQNGFSGVQFQTISYLSNAGSNMANFTTGSATSVFIAARNASANSGWNIFNTIWFNVGSAGTQRYHFSFNLGATAGTTLYANTALVGQVTSNAVSASSNAILGFTASSSLATIHTNGSSNGYSGVSLPDANNATTFLFNDARNNTGTSSNVAIFEMIGYNTQVSTADRQQIEGYLAWKWGLQANLPSTHPYKSSLIPPLLNPPTTLPITLQNTQATFLPNQISGCSLWLDANDSTTITGSPVTTWRDKSGLNNNATSAAGPTTSTYNGYPVISFNGSSQYMNSGNTVPTQSHTLIMVHRPAVINGNGQGNTSLFRFQAASSPYIVFPYMQSTTPRGYITSYDGAGAGSIDFGNSTLLENSAITALNLIVAAISSGNQVVYKNGTQQSSNTQSLSNGTSAALTIGRYPVAAGSEYYQGDLAEMIVFPTALATTQRQQVEGYLAWKWGIQSLLPATHPYKTGPPYSTTITNPSRSIGVSSVWQPTRITGCSLWFDATDPSSYITSSGLVTTWTSKGTNAISVTQVTSSNQPFIASNVQNKQSVMRFINPNSANVVNLNNTSVASNVMTTGNSVYLFIVHNPTYTLNTSFSYQTGGGTRISATNPELVSGSYFMRWDWVDPTEGNGRLSFNVGSGYITEGFKLECYYVNNGGGVGAEQGYRKNGTLLAAQSVGAGSFNATQVLTIGGFNPTTTLYYYRSDIGEIILFNQAITPLSVQQVEGYLAWKWGLQGSLPANHPFKLFPPPP